MRLPPLLVSVLTYAGFALILAGFVSVLRPLRFLRIRSRRTGLVVALAGLALAPLGAWWRWPLARATGATRLDAFVPEYQFFEFNETRVRARPEAVYRAIRVVAADEIRTFRTLTWIRRGGSKLPKRQESILAPGAHAPILDVATRTGFVWLADDPPREAVVGTVVCCGPGNRLRSADEFVALTRGGVAKAGMNFRIEDAGSGYSRLTTETRVIATDGEARPVFGFYWR